jgi:uncharacterized membrane protein (DUF2068 family)
VPRFTKRSFRYELIACGVDGHTLVGTKAAHVVPEDACFVREIDGARWHRCLRCDDWVVLPLPADPSRDHVESRDDIELPARGPILRDRIVLRVIAVDRAVHVTVFGLLAIALFTFASHSAALHRDYVNIMNDLSDGGPGASQARGILGYFSRVLSYSPSHLIRLGFLVAGYAALAAVEMVGLWRNRRWAEYLTSVAIAAFVPVEIYELSKGVSALKVAAFVINVLVLVYLVYAKRLFGLRGGYAAEQARRRDLSGWTAFDRADPGGPSRGTSGADGVASAKRSHEE